MVLAEFDTDAEAVKTLTVTALKDPDRFDHLVAQLRRNRDDRVAYDAVAAQITESGVPLVELENGWWLPEGAYWLSDLPPRAVPAPSPRPSTGPAPVTVPPWSKPTMATSWRTSVSIRWATAT